MELASAHHAWSTGWAGLRHNAMSKACLKNNKRICETFTFFPFKPYQMSQIYYLGYYQCQWHCCTENSSLPSGSVLIVAPFQIVQSNRWGIFRNDTLTMWPVWYVYMINIINKCGHVSLINSLLYVFILWQILYFIV